MGHLFRGLVRVSKSSSEAFASPAVNLPQLIFEYSLVENMRE